MSNRRTSSETWQTLADFDWFWSLLLQYQEKKKKSVEPWVLTHTHNLHVKPSSCKKNAKKGKLVGSWLASPTWRPCTSRPCAPLGTIMLQLLLFQAFQALKQFKIIPSTHAHTSCCFFGCEITFSFELVLSFVGFTVAPRLKSVAAVAWPRPV